MNTIPVRAAIEEIIGPVEHDENCWINYGKECRGCLGSVIFEGEVKELLSLFREKVEEIIGDDEVLMLRPGIIDPDKINAEMQRLSTRNRLRAEQHSLLLQELGE